MLVEAPIGNLSTKNIPEESIDWLELTWEQCIARATHAKTHSGTDVRILLKRGIVLHHGDILCDSPKAIVVNILPEEMLVGRPLDVAERTNIAYALGDLHVPMQLASDQTIITIHDGPTREVFERFKVSCAVESRRFEPTHRPLVQVVLSNDFRNLKSQI